MDMKPFFVIPVLVILLFAFSDCSLRAAENTTSTESLEVPTLANRPKNALSLETAGENSTAKQSELLPAVPGLLAPQEQETPAVFDPIKANGEYFTGWENPRIVLVFTGFQDGYLEPCGCAGMLEMKGGLSRRMSFINSIRAKNWPVVAIDAGDLCSEFGGKQAELKFHHTVEAFRQMKYDAVGLGPNDLRFPAEELLTVTVSIPGLEGMFTGANIAPFDFDPGLLAPFKIVQRNGIRVGVVSIITSELLENLDNSNLVKEDPVKKVKEILPRIESQNCEFLVLISHGTKGNVMKETQDFLASFPGKFRIVVVSDPPAEPPRSQPRVIEDRIFIQVGEKGKFAVVLGAFDDEKIPTRYQSVALDSRYLNAPIIVDMMESYQERLKELGPDGLGVKSYINPKSETMGTYIGSKECQSCHEEAYDVWRKSRHGSAWKTLTDVANPPRNHDPDCVSCHSVGWNSVEQYPYIGGYDMKDPDKKRHLVNVGCEDCHGPGELHKKAELGNNRDEQTRLRILTRLPLESAQKTCITCHDGDNSPNFHFETYWPKIEHKENPDDEDE